MFIFIVLTLYVVVHQILAVKFVNGVLGRRYGVYTVLISVCVILTLGLKNMVQNTTNRYELITILLFLIIYNIGIFRIKTRGRKKRNFSHDELPQSYLIYGTDESSRKLYSVLDGLEAISIAGYLSDNEAEKNKFINNIRCVCDTISLDEYMKKHKVGIIVPSDKYHSENMDYLMDCAHRNRTRFLILDPEVDLDSSNPAIARVPEIRPNDIIPSRVGPFSSRDYENFKDKIILVTGGAGSIGRVLIEQLLYLDVKKIICYDNSEINLYKLEQEYNRPKAKYKNKLEFKLGCISDKNQINEILGSGVQIVVNTAAYKHVPICENNINTCVKNNVIYTKILVDEVLRHCVKLFIHISTDKAVRPTNVMGATKRICEMLLMNYQKQSTETKFHLVRFGNVLGSSGSVFNLFVDQIKSGGPVTITDEKVTRYMMTIDDAAKLVLQSVAVCDAYSMFFLDMGQPVRITDLADKMIVAHGKIAKGDFNQLNFITKSIVGLRPGEKLYEELSHTNSATLTSVPGVLGVDIDGLTSLENVEIMNLTSQILNCGNSQEKRQILKLIVDDYDFCGNG